MLADMKYERRQQQVEARGAFANTCQSGSLESLIWVNYVFILALVQTCVWRMEASIKEKINHLHICDAPEVVWQQQKTNPSWNDVVGRQTRMWIHPCQRSHPDQRREENRSQEEVRIHTNVRWTILARIIASADRRCSCSLQNLHPISGNHQKVKGQSVCILTKLMLIVQMFFGGF